MPNHLTPEELSKELGIDREEVIRGARIIDGAGAPWFQSDVRIRAGHIAEISPSLPADGAAVKFRHIRRGENSHAAYKERQHVRVKVRLTGGSRALRERSDDEPG